MQKFNARKHEIFSVLPNLIGEPLLELQVLPPRGEAGQVDDERVRLCRLGVEQHRQGLQILRNIKNSGQPRLIAISPRVPFGHGVHDDVLEVEGLRVPSMVQDDRRVRMITQEDRDQVRQQFLPEHRHRSVDLKQGKHQNIGNILAGYFEQFGHRMVQVVAFRELK